MIGLVILSLLTAAHLARSKLGIREGNNSRPIVEEQNVFDLERGPPRLGDGCQHIYLDAGANIGVHTRFLFEPDTYPKAERAHKVFDQVFGKERDNRDVCSFGFEPNPAHVERHHLVEQAYANMGWRYKFVHAGLSDHDGNLTFWHQNDDRHKEWGFSLVKRGPDSRAEVVPLINFAKWIQHHITERRLPNKLYGNYTDLEPKVVMKMDIEGSEYFVLPSLLFSGVFCSTIDYAFGETHPHFVKPMLREKMDNETGRGELKLLTPDEAKLWFRFVMREAFNTVPPESCKGRWLDLDDESYLRDGKPFPKPQN